MSDDMKRMQERIRKLLRLGRSPNRHEAMAAIEKAHELANSCGIAIHAINPDADPVAITTEFAQLRRRTNARKLCHMLLCEHFSVEVLFNGLGITYVGPAENIAIAQHIEKLLLATVANEWSKMGGRKYSDNKAYVALSKASFEDAFFSAVGDTLAARRIRNDQAEIKMSIDTYLSKHYLNIKISKFRVNSSRSITAFDSGYESGARVVLSRPVAGSGQVKELC